MQYEFIYRGCFASPPMTTDTGMVDKLALIISGAPFPSERSRAKARAVLECLRTPTPEMVEAAYGQSTWYDLEVEEVMSEDIPAIWQAMIDAALSHTQGEGE